MASILLVDDEAEILDFTKFALEAKGYEVFTATSGQEALRVFQDKRPQLLLLDYKLDGVMTGMDVLNSARAVDPAIPAVVITGLTEQADAIKARCDVLGRCVFLQKPLQMDAVYDAVKKALEG